MGGLTSQGEIQLKSTYLITMLLQDFEKRLKLYDMQHVFNIIKPDNTLTTGSIKPDTIDLLKKYADNATTIKKIKSSIGHYCSWGQLYDPEDLNWTR